MKHVSQNHGALAQPTKRERNELFSALCGIGFGRTAATAEALADALRARQWGSQTELMDHVVGQLAEAAAAAEAVEVAAAADCKGRG